MSEWQPINTAPKDGTPVLAINPHSTVGVIMAVWATPRRADDPAWCAHWNGDPISMQPEFWQPVPQWSRRKA